MINTIRHIRLFTTVNIIVLVALFSISITGVISPFIMLNKIDDQVIDLVKTEYKSEPGDSYRLISVESNNIINVRVDNDGKYKGSLMIENEEARHLYERSRRALLTIFIVGCCCSILLIGVFIIKLWFAIYERI